MVGVKNRTVSSGRSRAVELRCALLRAVMLVSLGCLAPTAAGAQETEGLTALATVETFMAAFNRHDPDAMAELVAVDFELYYVDEDGTSALAMTGPEQLRTEMVGYFADRPSVRSEIAGAVDGPVFVSFREQIVGGQSSLAVYEVREGRIKRVWYYPAEDGG